MGLCRLNQLRLRLKLWFFLVAFFVAVPHSHASANRCAILEELGRLSPRSLHDQAYELVARVSRKEMEPRDSPGFMTDLMAISRQSASEKAAAFRILAEYLKKKHPWSFEERVHPDGTIEFYSAQAVLIQPDGAVWKVNSFISDLHDPFEFASRRTPIESENVAPDAFARDHIKRFESGVRYLQIRLGQELVSEGASPEDCTTVMLHGYRTKKVAFLWHGSHENSSINHAMVKSFYDQGYNVVDLRVVSNQLHRRRFYPTYNLEYDISATLDRLSCLGDEVLEILPRP